MRPFEALRMRNGGALLWTPSYLSTPPKLWLDDTSGVTNVSGAASQWNDISGQGRHFVQSTSSARPTIQASGLNGLRTLRFDGTDDYLANTALPDLYRNVGNGWALTISKKRSSTVGASGASIFYANATTSGSDPNRFNVLAIRASTPGFGAFASRRQTSDAQVVIARTSSDVGNWVMRIDIADWTNGDVFTYVNSALDASDTTTMTSGNTSNVANAGLLIGALGIPGLTGSYSDIDVAAVVAGASGIPSAGEIEKLFGWAAWRYGLTGILDPSNPYIAAPPTV